MNKAIQNQKNLIFIVIILIIVALSIIFVLNPLANISKNNYQSYLDTNAELRTLNKKYENLKEYKKIESEIVKANENFLKFIPDQDQTEDIMVSLDALAKKTSNSLPTFTVVDSTTNTKTSGRIARSFCVCS